MKKDDLKQFKKLYYELQSTLVDVTCTQNKLILAAVEDYPEYSKDLKSKLWTNYGEVTYVTDYSVTVSDIEYDEDTGKYEVTSGDIPDEAIQEDTRSAFFEDYISDIISHLNFKKIYDKESLEFAKKSLEKTLQEQEKQLAITRSRLEENNRKLKIANEPYQR